MVDLVLLDRLKLEGMTTYLQRLLDRRQHAFDVAKNWRDPPGKPGVAFTLDKSPASVRANVVATSVAAADHAAMVALKTDALCGLVTGLLNVTTEGTDSEEFRKLLGEAEQKRQYAKTAAEAAAAVAADARVGVIRGAE